MTKALALTAFFTAITACAAEDPSGGNGPPKGGPNDPPGMSGTPDAFLESLIRRDCQKAFACRAEYPATEGTFTDDWGASEADCVDTDEDYLVRDDVAAAVSAGTIDFDAGLAASCLADAQYPATCPAFFTDYAWPDSCYGALAGKVADGGACTTSWQCGPDSDCTAAVCAPSTDDEARRVPHLVRAIGRAGWRRS